MLSTLSKSDERVWTTVIMVLNFTAEHYLCKVGTTVSAVIKAFTCSPNMTLPMLAGYSLTLQWDCCLDLWSTGRWLSPQLQSSPLDPPQSGLHRPAEEKRQQTDTEHDNPNMDKNIHIKLAGFKRITLKIKMLNSREQKRHKYLQMSSYCSQRGFGDETQVCRAWGWMLGFRLKLLAQLVKVKLLFPKPQSFTVSLVTADTACVGA